VVKHGQESSNAIKDWQGSVKDCRDESAQAIRMGLAGS